MHLNGKRGEKPKVMGKSHRHGQVIAATFIEYKDGRVSPDSQ